MMRRNVLTALCLALAASACASGPDVDIAPPATAAEAYQLGPGDKVRVTVFGQPTLSGEYTITGNGDIAFPLVGNVPAGNASVEQLQEALRTKLAAGYLDDPRVSAEILDYRPFYILGEVNTPGKYPFAIGLTVEQAVASAGGFSYRANTRMVYIKRAMETREWLVDLREQPAYPVRPGDTIRIGERFF